MDPQLSPHPPTSVSWSLFFSSRFRVSSRDDWYAPRIHRDGPQEVGRSGWTPTAWCPAYRSPDRPGGAGHVITLSRVRVCPCVYVPMCPVCVCPCALCVYPCLSVCRVCVCVCVCVTSRGTCACPRSLGSRRPSELTTGVAFALHLPAGRAAPRPRAASASLPRTSTTWGWGTANTRLTVCPPGPGPAQVVSRGHPVKLSQEPGQTQHTGWVVALPGPLLAGRWHRARVGEPSRADGGDDGSTSPQNKAQRPGVSAC